MFREMFNVEVYGTSNCCHKPIYTPNVDGVGMCSYCGEWAEFEENEEDVYDIVEKYGG